MRMIIIGCSTDRSRARSSAADQSNDSKTSACVFTTETKPSAKTSFKRIGSVRNTKDSSKPSSKQIRQFDPSKLINRIRLCFIDFLSL